MLLSWQNFSTQQFRKSLNGICPSPFKFCFNNIWNQEHNHTTMNSWSNSGWLEAKGVLELIDNLLSCLHWWQRLKLCVMIIIMRLFISCSYVCNVYESGFLTCRLVVCLLFTRSQWQQMTLPGICHPMLEIYPHLFPNSETIHFMSVCLIWTI